MKMFGLEIKKQKPSGAITQLDPESVARVIGSVINPWEATINQVSYPPEDYIRLVNSYRSWIYICANKNATSVAESPIRLYVAKPSSKSKMYFKTAHVDRQKKIRIMKQANLTTFTRKAVDIEEIIEHPFLDLLSSVNPLINRFDLWEITQLWMELTGNAYWYVWRDQLGVPQEIWPIPPQYMRIIGSRETVIGGYFYERGVVRIPFDYDEIVHFKFMSPQGSLYGQGPLAAIIDTYENDQSVRIFESTLMKNAGRPEGVLETDSKLTPETFKRLKEDWMKNYAGVNKVGRTLILENGLKYNPITFTPREMNYIVGRKLNREEIAAAFGVPISKLTTENVNRSNSEQGNYQYAIDTREPRLRRLEEKINERLMPMYDENLFVAYDSTVPEDREFGLRAMESRLKSYLTTVNEERKELGMDEVEWGSVPLAQAGIAPLGSQSVVPISEDSAEGEDKSGVDNIEEESEKKNLRLTREQLSDIIDDVVTTLSAKADGFLLKAKVVSQPENI